jgi:hypothetical protein
MRHIALDVPAGSPPWTPAMPVSVFLETARATHHRGPRLVHFTRPARRSARHSKSTTARIVKVIPGGGDANEKVQPAWRCS